MQLTINKTGEKKMTNSNLKARLEDALETTLKKIKALEKEFDKVRESGELEKTDDLQWQNEELHQHCKAIRRLIKKQEALEEAYNDLCNEAGSLLMNF